MTSAPIFDAITLTKDQGEFPHLSLKAINQFLHLFKDGDQLLRAVPNRKIKLRKTTRQRYYT